MAKTKEPTIEILDEQRIAGKYFRVITSVNGHCKQSLPCRVSLTDLGFVISFYGPHDVFGAERNYKPLTAIPVDMAPLVAKAMEHAKKIQDSWIEAEDNTSR